MGSNDRIALVPYTRRVDPAPEVEAPSRPRRQGLEFAFLLVVLLALGKGPLYRLRYQWWPLTTDFLYDWAVQLTFGALHLVAIGLLIRELRARRVRLPAWFTAAAFGLAGLCALSTIWSETPTRSLAQGVQFILTTGTGVWVGVRWRPRPLLWAISTSQLVGVAWSWWAVDHGWSFSKDITGAFAGIYFNRNSLGQPATVSLLCAVVLVIDAVVLRRSNRRGNRYLAACLLLVVIAAPIDVRMIRGAGSLTPRVALASAMIAGLAYGLVGRASAGRRRAPTLLAIGSSAAAFVVGAAAFAARQSLTERVDKSATLEGRTIIWQITLRYLRDQPVLGYGWLGIWDRADVRADLVYRGMDVYEAHNGFVEVLLAGGYLIAPVLAAVFVTATYLASLAACRTTGVLRSWPLVLLTYVIVVNFTESFIGANLLPWVLLVGVTVRAHLDSTDGAAV